MVFFLDLLALRLTSSGLVVTLPNFCITPFIEASSESFTELRNNEFSKVQNFLNFVSTFWQNIAGLKTQMVNNSTLPNNIEKF